MFLKYRYHLGYEELCTQVTDSLSWRRFCRIGLQANVPDESTIRKITRRCGPDVIDQLNQQLLAAANERGDILMDRVRADTAVVEADIKYPTDSGLLTSATCQDRYAITATRQHRDHRCVHRPDPPRRAPCRRSSNAAVFGGLVQVIPHSSFK
jgi:IS5 family transposase